MAQWRAAEVEQGILDGVLLEAIDKRSRKGLGIPDEVDGVLISDVLAESPYADLMARGMVTLEVNGAAVTTPEAFEAQLARRRESSVYLELRH